MLEPRRNSVLLYILKSQRQTLYRGSAAIMLSWRNRKTRPALNRMIFTDYAGSSPVESTENIVESPKFARIFAKLAAVCLVAIHATYAREARLADVPIDDVLSGNFPKPGSCPMCGRCE